MCTPITSRNLYTNIEINCKEGGSCEKDYFVNCIVLLVFVVIGWRKH